MKNTAFSLEGKTAIVTGGSKGLTMLMCNEWAKNHIQVNAIVPGYMVTENTEALRNDQARYHAILDRIPAG